MDTTIRDILVAVDTVFPEREFVFTRLGQEYRAKTFGELAGEVYGLANALLPAFAGRHILVWGENSAEWMVADLAVAGFVGVSVCADKKWGEDELAYVIVHAEIACVFYGEECRGMAKKLAEQYAIPFYSLAEDLPRLAEQGSRKLPEPFPTERQEKLCKIMFSSGTTGRPKAIMLSEKNIFSSFECLLTRAPMGANDCCYLFLPLSHTYGGIYNFLYVMIMGMRLYLCSETKAIGEELLLAQPTVFCGVPQTYAYFYQLSMQQEKPEAALRACLAKASAICFAAAARSTRPFAGFTGRLGWICWMHTL